MNFSSIHQKFSEAIFWNVIWYVTYKITSLILLYVLYHRLSPLYFSTWASVNAILFITLIWLDFGFRKSIPRFAPLFLTATYRNRFIAALMLTQTFLLALGLLPFLTVLSMHTSITLPLDVCALLFITEGFKNLVQTLYHSHFKQKQFTITASCITALEAALALLYINVAQPNAASESIILFLLILKTISNTVVTGLTLLLLPRTFALDAMHKPSKPPIHYNAQNLIVAFIKHSFFIWFSTGIKTLTERNILFLYVTHYFGAPVANTFKIFYDSAISFQRIIIKALGTADTSLLAHIHLTLDTTHDSRNTLLEQAITIIAKTIYKLLFILIIIATGISLLSYTTTIHTKEMLLIFGIVSIGYILEVILSPYERILEVKQEYPALIGAYAPYMIIITLGALIQFYHIVNFSLLSLVATIQTARIISAGTMWLINKKGK